MARTREEVNEPTVTYGSGNVFADLGFEDAEEMLAKAKLAVAIKDVIKERKLTQGQAAKLMGIDQPRVSKLVHGRLSDFATDSLLQYLLHLGSDVEIVVHKPTVPPKRVGAISVAYQ
jgi:predicted XRE-type DNA-binding protein